MDRYEAEQERLRKAGQDALAVRAASGMGFWRLVLVIACGIVVGLAASDALRWAIAYLMRPPQ